MQDTMSLVEKRPIMHFAKHTPYANEQICKHLLFKHPYFGCQLFVPLRFTIIFYSKYPFLKPLHFAFPFGVSILCSFYTERGHFYLSQIGLYYFTLTILSLFLDKAGLLDIIQPNKIHKNFDKD
jgi:hypothetical protein